MHEHLPVLADQHAVAFPDKFDAEHAFHNVVEQHVSAEDARQGTVLLHRLDEGNNELLGRHVDVRGSHHRARRVDIVLVPGTRGRVIARWQLHVVVLDHLLVGRAHVGRLELPGLCHLDDGRQGVFRSLGGEHTGGDDRFARCDPFLDQRAGAGRRGTHFVPDAGVDQLTAHLDVAADGNRGGNQDGQGQDQARQLRS